HLKTATKLVTICHQTLNAFAKKADTRATALRTGLSAVFHSHEAAVEIASKTGFRALLHSQEAARPIASIAGLIALFHSQRAALPTARRALWTTLRNASDFLYATTNAATRAATAATTNP